MIAPYSFSDTTWNTSSPIAYRKASDLVSPKGRLLLLHGVGSNESNLIPIVAALPKDLEILLLRGPLHLGPQAFAWYEVTFTGNGPSFNQEQAEHSRKLLAEFIEQLPALPTVIAGFSQGGIMSASLGLTEPKLVKGFSLLSGRILKEIEPQIASTEDLGSLTAFIAHGREDKILPATCAQESDALLERLGVCHETHFYDMGHQIIPEELEAFSAWLVSTLGLKTI